MKHTFSSPKRTQESKITSTPQRSQNSSFQRSISPNISSIGFTTTENVRTPGLHPISESDKENESQYRRPRRRLSSISRRSSIYSDFEHEESDIIDQDLKSVPNIRKTGLIWKFYKPLHEDSLYAEVLENSHNSIEVVLQFLRHYKRHPRIAVSRLIQFCVDVCGFQNFDIFSHYEFQESSAKEILTMLETDDIISKQENLRDTGRYLFMESKEELAKSLKLVIYNFIQSLIYIAHEQGILVEEFFSKNLFIFIKYFSFSMIRPTRHTCVILAGKILTALINIYVDVVNNFNQESNLSGVSESSKRLFELKKSYETLLKCFYFIFLKNCRLQDNKIILMRIDCIREFQIWIKSLPHIFISDFQAIRYLMKLIIDGSSEVRYTAINACADIIPNPNVLEFIQPDFKELSNTIAKRFYDVNSKVVIKAIDIFSIILRVDSSLITMHRLKVLCTLIFNNYFSIGQAACRLLHNFMCLQGNSPEVLLENLAKLVIEAPGHCKPAFLVEGSIYIFPEIQNWMLYVKILLDKKLESNVLVTIAELFHEAVHQTLKGQSSVLREDSRKVIDIDQSEHLEVARILPNLNKILVRYLESPDVLIEILAIFSCIDSEVITGSFCKEYIDLCNTITLLFNNHSDERLLNKLIEILDHMLSIPNIGDRVQRFCDHICEDYSEELLQFIQKPTSDNTGITLKVMILYHFNLNPKFQWETLFDSWGDVDENTTGNLLVCCKSYLVWSLRNLTDPTNKRQPRELANHCTLMLRICNEFISTCFNMLQNLAGQELHLKVYRCLCDFYNTFSKELDAPIKFNKQFETLNLKIEDTQLHTLLVIFLEKYIINNKTMSLEDRCENIIKYISLVHNNILPIESLGCLFKYYYMYYDEYGRLIEKCLNEVINSEDENTVLLMVVYTLTYVYEQILKKHNSIDMKTEDARQLRLLTKQFLAHKYFRTPKKRFIKLLYFSINYSFKDESKYPFLYFAKYFIDLIIDDEDKQQVFDFFKEKVPSELKQADAILYFVNQFKINQSITSEKERKKLVPKKVASKAKTKRTTKQTKKPATKPIKKMTGNKKAGPKTLPTPKVKNKNVRSIDTDSEDTQTLTIHDSSSDDLSLTSLQI